MFNLIGSLSNDDVDVNKNVKIAIGLDWQNNFARASRFFVHVFAVTARLRRESALFHVLWRTWVQDDFVFLVLHFDMVFYNLTPDKMSHIWWTERNGISEIKFKAARLHFFVAVAVVVV